MHFDSCHVYIFYIQLFQKRIKIQINIWRNTFYKERVHVYMYGFLTSSILIDEGNNYTGVILRIARFDLNCPLFTCLDFWHRLSSIVSVAAQAGLSLTCSKTPKTGFLVMRLIIDAVLVCFVFFLLFFFLFVCVCVCVCVCVSVCVPFMFDVFGKMWISFVLIPNLLLITFATTRRRLSKSPPCLKEN